MRRTWRAEGRTLSIYSAGSNPLSSEVLASLGLTGVPRHEVSPSRHGETLM